MTAPTEMGFWNIWSPDSARARLLQTKAGELYPTFSPDGQWLAYTSTDSARTEVYVQQFPGPGGRGRDVWIRLLTESGYVSARALPCDHSDLEPGSHEVFVATRPPV